MCKEKAGRILGAWYFYYTVSDSAFIINAALIDYNDPLDKVTGTVTRYTLMIHHGLGKHKERLKKQCNERSGRCLVC